MTPSDQHPDPRPDEEDALRRMFAQLAEDPDAPPSRVSALGVRAAATRRQDARRRVWRTSLLAAAGLAVVALLVPVVLRSANGSTTEATSAAGGQAFSTAAASSAAGPAAGGGADMAQPQAAAPEAAAAPSGVPDAAGGSQSAAAGGTASGVSSAASAAGSATSAGSAATAAAGSSAAGSSAAGGGSCAVPTLDAAATQALTAALPTGPGVLQEVAPAVLECARAGTAGTAFDVVAGGQAGSLQVSVLAAEPAECAAGCVPVDGAPGVLLRNDASGTTVAVPGPAGWVLVEQSTANLSGLPTLAAVPYTPAELVAAGQAVLAVG